jgi:hypothetical protein
MNHNGARSQRWGGWATAEPSPTRGIRRNLSDTDHDEGVRPGHRLPLGRRPAADGLLRADGSSLPPIEEMGEKIEALKESALRGMETLLTNGAGI